MISWLAMARMLMVTEGLPSLAARSIITNRPPAGRAQNREPDLRSSRANKKTAGKSLSQQMFPKDRRRA